MMGQMHAAEVSECVLLAGAGAIIVAALVAGAVTIWRTKALLAGEASRQNVRLAHDRAHSERTELRSVIDEALQAAQDGQYQGVELQALIARVGDGDEADDDQEVYEAIRTRLIEAIRRLNGLQSRLAVRLSSDATLPNAVSDCRGALSMVRLYASFAWPTSEQGDREELEEVIRVSERKIETLEDEARALARSRLDVEDAA